MRVFIDSDVVISSLLSSSGAAYFLLHQTQITPVISSLSLVELRIVAKRLGIASEKLERIVRQRFEVIDLTTKLKDIQEEYLDYVTDINDAHIVAGVCTAKTKYFISYNLKHFKSDKIKNKLGVVLLTPALFLQYLRSQ